jgi:hypothetical protein
MTLVPDSIDPVVGWRMWDVAAIEISAGVWQWRLKSPFAFTAWVPGIAMRAECSRCVSPPTRRCGCGIYAFAAGPFAEDLGVQRTPGESFCAIAW